MEDGNILESSAADSGAENTGGNDSTAVDNSGADSVVDVQESVPDILPDFSEGEEVPSESSSVSAETEIPSESVMFPEESQFQADGETESETITESETELETETEKEAIEDILKDIQNTLSGNSVSGSSGTAEGESVSGNSVQESVSGNDYVSVDYTEGLRGIQDSLDGLQVTVTCIFIVICLYFVKQAAKHFIKGFMGGRENG